MASDHFVWPLRNWSLAELSEAQYETWNTNGYLVVEDAVPRSLAAEAAAAIREYVGANDSRPETWYSNTLDIYSDRNDDGTKPIHGPCGMVVGLNHHASLWQLRQHPRLHRIFADLYGTPRLLVTHDRAHFKPPENPAYPAWSEPGAVHRGLHFDVDTSRRPVPFGVQGVIYLEPTSAEQGALRVVPGFHKRIGAWRGSAWRADELEPEAIAVEGGAGALVAWHSLLPHGPGRVLPGHRPRVSAYVTMLPVDAAPFLAPGADASTPLNLPDAGTLAYEGSNEQLEANLGTNAEPGGTEERPGGNTSPQPVRRLTAAQRAERWRLRLPLVDEDPREEELPRRPPGEEHGMPFAGLTALGRRLTGLDPWPEGEQACFAE